METQATKDISKEFGVSGVDLAAAVNRMGDFDARISARRAEFSAPPPDTKLITSEAKFESKPLVTSSVSPYGSDPSAIGVTLNATIWIAVASGSTITATKYRTVLVP